jgi:hypothetical protein
MVEEAAATLVSLSRTVALLGILTIAACTASPIVSSTQPVQATHAASPTAIAASEVAEDHCGAEAVSLAFILSVAAEERVECFEQDDVSFVGYYPEPFGAGGCAGDEIPGDGWLSPCQLEGIVLYAEPGDALGLLVHLHPDSGLQAAVIPTGRWLAVRGHFDDPAAERCRRVSGGREIVDSEFVAACRREFAAVEIRLADQ